MNKFLVSILTIVLLSGTVFTSCNKKEDSGLAESNMKNVKYGANSAQSMDIYLPPGRTTTNTKVLVFIHGGGWSSGDKTDFDPDINAIRSQLNDYAIFNINYRLANNGSNLFPVQMDDIQMAIDFINVKAGEYKIDASKIGLIGASAGAHLSMLHAYKHNANGNIKAVIDLFGPADLTTLYNNHPFPAASQPALLEFLGTTPTANPALYNQASPINYVTAQAPPTLILHGDLDFIVPIEQSIALRNKFTSVGATVEMHTYTGEGHGWFGTKLTDTYTRTMAFIKAHVK